MMSEDGIPVPSTVGGFVQELNSNPNPNPNSIPLKRKRSLPGTPGKHLFLYLLHTQLFSFLCVYVNKIYSHIFLSKLIFCWIRSRCRSHSFVPKILNGNKPILMWNLQQGFPEGPELAASPTRPQSSMEAKAKNKQRSSQKGVCLSWEELRAPRSVKGARRSHWNKEALQPKARREEMEVREMF